MVRPFIDGDWAQLQLSRTSSDSDYKFSLITRTLVVILHDERAVPVVRDGAGFNFPLKIFNGGQGSSSWQCFVPTCFIPMLRSYASHFYALILCMLLCFVPMLDFLYFVPMLVFMLRSYVCFLCFVPMLRSWCLLDICCLRCFVPIHCCYQGFL